MSGLWSGTTGWDSGFSGFSGGGGFSGGASLLPAAQTVQFGAKTPRGFGGHALGYNGVGTLQVISDPSGFWTIDAYNELVLAGTYGTTPPALATGNAAYTITVSDGIYTGTVTINVIANAYSVTDYATDTDQSFQLRTVLNSGSAVNFGDTIYLRDGCTIGQNNVSYRIRKASQFTGTAPTSGTGTGWVVIRPDTDYGATIACLNVENNTISAAYLSFEKCNLQRFNVSGGSPGSVNSLLFSNTSGNGAQWVRVKECQITSRLEYGTVALDDNIGSGVRVLGGLSTTSNIFFYDNVGHDLYDMFTVTGSNVEIIGTTAYNIWNDWAKGLYSAYKVNWNYVYDKKYGDADNHGDYLQNAMDGLVAGTYAGGEVIGNIFVRGVGTPGRADGQGIFLSGNTVTGIVFTDCVIRGNLYVGSFTRGINVENMLDPIIEWNTVVADLDATVNRPNIWFAGGTDGGFARFNVVSSPSGPANENPVGNPTVSPPTIEDNHIGVDTLAEYQAAFVNPQFGGSLSLGRADAAAKFAMKVGGPLDVTVNGSGVSWGAAGTGYVDYVNRTTDFPALDTPDFSISDGTVITENGVVQVGILTPNDATPAGAYFVMPNEEAGFGVSNG